MPSNFLLDARHCKFYFRYFCIPKNIFELSSGMKLFEKFDFAFLRPCFYALLSGTNPVFSIRFIYSIDEAKLF